MTCHICQAEAVTRCFNCGELVCAAHGKNQTCDRCSAGIVAGDPRGDRISVRPLVKQPQHAWWRPQQAEEYHPPACYECQGLTRAVCRNCGCHYCHEHAGPPGLCKDCGQSARLGTYVVVAVLAMFLILLFFIWASGM
jgi:hypothetical protein